MGSEKHSFETENLNSGKAFVKLKGKCFNSTVEVQKHMERCPWCPDFNNAALIEHVVSYFYICIVPLFSTLRFKIEERTVLFFFG